MGCPVEIVLLCFINLVWIQQTLSDGPATNADKNKWTCTCFVAREQTLNFVLANCSSSCDCSPAPAESGESRWTCICNVGGLPRFIGEENGSSCFTSCNCNAGSLSELEPSKKQISVKVAFIILLLCLILTAIALVAIMLWHVYWKDKRQTQWASSSSDRLTICIFLYQQSTSIKFKFLHTMVPNHFNMFCINNRLLLPRFFSLFSPAKGAPPPPAARRITARGPLDRWGYSRSYPVLCYRNIYRDSKA